MVQVAEKILSPDEYLDWEEDQEARHEYLNGRIYAMSGGSIEHITVIQNIGFALRLALPGGCRVFSSELRVNVSATGLYTYPDLAVVCGELKLDGRTKSATLLNPILIIEVLSASTEAYDRGDKFAQYRRLDSLTDYILVSTRFPMVEHFRRQQDGDWLLAVRTELEESLPISALGIALPLADIYEMVEFPALPALSLRSETAMD